MASKKSTSDEPATMDELIAQTGYKLRGFSRGEEVEGVVLSVGPKSLILDIGGKSEGVVAERNFETAGDFIKTLKPGDKVKATVLLPEIESGQTLVSLLSAAQEAAWDTISHALKEGKPLRVVGKSVGKGGLTVELAGLIGFIPTSQLGAKASANPADLIGKTFLTKVLEVDRNTGRIVLSERRVSEAETIAKEGEALSKIKPGQVFEGEVTGIAPFGAFVKIEENGIKLEGLVHLSELSWKKVEKPEDEVSLSDKVKVEVLGVDAKEGRLALSIRKTQKDPWKGIGERYPKEKTVKGKVTKVSDWGFFVEIEPGVEGLLHFSKIPAGTKITEGQVLDCFVEEVDEEARRISLGLVLKEKPIGYK